MTKSIRIATLSKRGPPRDPKFSFDLVPSVTKAGLLVSLFSPPRNSFVSLITHWGWENLQLSPLISRILKPINCLLRSVQKIQTARRLPDLSQNSAVSDMTAIWDQLGLTVYSTVDFSVAMMFLDNLIVWHTIIPYKNGSLSYGFPVSWGKAAFGGFDKP